MERFSRVSVSLRSRPNRTHFSLFFHKEKNTEPTRSTPESFAFLLHDECRRVACSCHGSFPDSIKTKVILLRLGGVSTMSPVCIMISSDPTVGTQQLSYPCVCVCVSCLRIRHPCAFGTCRRQVAFSFGTGVWFLLWGMISSPTVVGRPPERK